MNATPQATNNNAPAELNASQNGCFDMITAIYLRVSTEHQTLEQQLLSMKGWLAWQEIDLDCPNTIIFEEHGKSAAKKKYHSIRDRPSGRKMMELIDSRVVGKVVVVDFDRVWRDGVTGVMEMRELQSKGCHVLCTSAGGGFVDLSTSQGFKTFWNAMGDAEEEIMKISERVERKQDFNLSTGKTITGKTFGWVDTSAKDHPQHGDLIPDWEEQAVINWILQEVHGRFKRSWASCARKLNDAEVPSATGRLGVWQSSSVKRVTESKTQLTLAPRLPKRYVTIEGLGKIRCDMEEKLKKIAVTAA